MDEIETFLSDAVRDAELQIRSVPSGSSGDTIHIMSAISSHRQVVHIEETWRRKRQLGCGSYGSVWLEACVTGPKAGQSRAVKEMRKNYPKAAIGLSGELEALTKFSHQKYVHCFVQCYGWYQTEDTIFVAMEYLKYGDLSKYVDIPFSEAEAKTISAQLIEGLQFMHSNGFTHRDLKPDNILVYQPRPDWWVKIADFGITKRVQHDNTALRTMVGTEAYMAPEAIGFLPSQAPPPPGSGSTNYTSAVDMWALGEVLFRMMTQRPTFSTRHELFQYVHQGLPFPESSLEATGASQDCRDFIMKLMAIDPTHRIDAKNATAHPWMKGNKGVVAAGQGIDRVNNEDIVALMQHLTARDAQRSARDTEIVALLMNAASEMRNSLQELKGLQETSDDVISNFVENKAIHSPRPYLGTQSIQRNARIDSFNEASAKRKNPFKRALQSLSVKGSSELRRTEDMLVQLLGEVDALKAAQSQSSVSEQGSYAFNSQLGNQRVQDSVYNSSEANLPDRPGDGPIVVNTENLSISPLHQDLHEGSEGTASWSTIGPELSRPHMTNRTAVYQHEASQLSYSPPLNSPFQSLKLRPPGAQRRLGIRDSVTPSAIKH